MKRKNPTQFRDRFKLYKEKGILPYKAGRIDDEVVYRERMKDVARENYQNWGYESAEAAWLDQLNNPTYDYRSYYTDPEYYLNASGNSTEHWPDKYKTPRHETFSNESIYHGLKSDKNPYGLRGGMWIGDKFVPAAWQRQVNIPKYEDGKVPDEFLKKLRWEMFDENGPTDYERAVQTGDTPEEALNYMRELYEKTPWAYHVYGGELPGVTVKPNPNSVDTVYLTTYYPVTSIYPYSGHSKLSVIGDNDHGGHVIDVKSNDPEYNFVTNNCSDATRRALEMASGKKVNPFLFTTPGDVKDFAEDELGGWSGKPIKGRVTTRIILPTSGIRKIVQYSKQLEKARRKAKNTSTFLNNLLKRVEDTKSSRLYYSKTISPLVKHEDGKLPKYEDGITPYQKYIDATEDQQNGRYLQQGPWNNPIVLFFDPTGVSGYPQVKEAFDNGNAYDKAVSILGAIPLLGKLKSAARAGSVVNIPSDVKSYLDWDDYYRSIIYKDNKSGSIGPRKYIGSADYHEFSSLIRKGEIRKATPTEIQWWYDWTGGDSASPGLPLGSAILQPFENYKRLQKIQLLKDKNFNGRWFKKHENGKLPKYADGLTPYNKRDVNTNEATYNSEEDLYSPRYTLPEVTVTGTNKRPHTHAPIHLSKNAYKMLTEDLLGAMTTGSDVGDVLDVGKDLYNLNYTNAGIGAAMLAVPNFIEKPLKPIGRFARNFVIDNNDKISTFLAKSGVVKRAMNYAMHQTDAANPVSEILRDIGIKKYGDRNPSNVSIDEIKSFLSDRSKDKTKLKLVASYILFGKNKNKVIKDHTGIVGIDYQTNKTFNTNPASGFIGPKESVLFGKDMTAGKIEPLADYGVHSDYIVRRPDLTPRRVYSTDAPYRNGLPTVDDDFITHTIPRTLSSLDDYMPIKTPFGIGSYDAGGHLIELGRGVDKKYYLRGLDIYKFDVVDYAKKHLDAFNNTHDYLQWAKQHPFLNLGLTTVLKAVKPIIVRSRWTPVDQVLDSYLTPVQVKRQIRDVYDQLNQSALMYLVPRMNSYIK